jgi:UDP-glucose 4-epimerase
MRILLTGASSFTGLWFARALAEAGHKVTAPLLRAKEAYDGLRGERVALLGKYAEIVWSCAFGDERFVELAARGPWDRLCHHAAQIGDYRNPDFDIAGALAANTRNARAVLATMRGHGLKGAVLTGSVFEAHEGAGTEPLRAFSPYGVSKGLTAEVMRFRCAEAGVPLAKFVIPNPFGPYEEARFCNYLLQCWKAGKVASVKTPAYVRDNIHVSLLARCYAQAVEDADKAEFRRINPSGYVETQGEFAKRFAGEIGARLGIECPLELLTQTEFPEPKERFNTEPVDGQALDWDEDAAWDELAGYYRDYFKLGAAAA